MNIKEHTMWIKILEQILKDYKYKIENTVNNQKIKKYTIYKEFLEKIIQKEQVAFDNKIEKQQQKERDE